MDVNCLVRMWDLRTGECIRSYPLEQVEQQEYDASVFRNTKKIQHCELDPSRKILMVALQGGLVQLHNVNTGMLLYNRSVREQLQIDSDVSNIIWLNDLGHYWFVLTCWEGAVVFVSHPQEANGREFLTCRKVHQGYHKKDIVTIDVVLSKTTIVTGSIDNVLFLWNSYNGASTKKICLPAEKL